MENNYYTPSLAANCCGSSPNTDQEMINITAQIVDEVNDPVPYAHVWIEETQQGTTSDANGYFQLLGVPASANVQFSYQQMVTVYVAGSIYNVVKINTTSDLPPVIIDGANSNPNLKYFGLGLLAVTLVYAMSRGDKKAAVKAKPTATKKAGAKSKPTTRSRAKKQTVKADV